MTYQLSLSDDRYQTVIEMAAARGQTPDELLTTLIDEAWERACGPYDAAFQNDPGWRESARVAATPQGHATQGILYSSTAELFQALGASQAEIEEARRLEVGHAPPGDDR
jgi:hypothetical protein